MAVNWPRPARAPRRPTRSERSPEHPLGGERAAFALLAVFVLCAGAFALAFALAEGTHESAGRNGLGGFAFAMGLAALTWWVAPRFGPRALDVCILAAAVGIAQSAADTIDRNDQLSAALVLLMLGVITAFFVPTPRAWVLLGAEMGVFALALVLNHQGVTAWAYVVMGGANVVLAHTVSRLGQTMRAEAEHDPLTDVLNRHGLAEQARLVEALARRAGVRVFVAYLDLDAFKRYNDEHGHEAGDHLLAGATAAWGRVLRAGDLLVRWGGDEFLVVLTVPTVEDAQRVLERMRAAHPAAWTYGVTEWREDEALDVTVARADRALLEAKAHRVPGGVGRIDPGPWPPEWTEARRNRAALAAQLDPQILLEPVRDGEGAVHDFRLVDANAPACAFRHARLAELVGVGIRDRMPAAVRDPMFAVLVRTLERGEPFVDDAYECPASDPPRTFSVRVGPSEDALSITWRETTPARPPTPAESAAG